VSLENDNLFILNCKSNSLGFSEHSIIIVVIIIEILCGRGTLKKEKIPRNKPQKKELGDEMNSNIV
jgi:hypothetical protein